MAQLRCFAAMPIAPGSDCDRIYFTKLKPTLVKMHIRCFRIDEIHHLENIDGRILKEIDKSDLMVADLTNERPSVYFEAGYGEKKGIPVIYTCRADHLRAQGNVLHRVHFDVRQRPIVSWANENDRTFQRRLRERVRSITKQLLARLSVENEDRIESLKFSRLSTQRRQKAMYELAVTAGTKHGYRAKKGKDLGRSVWMAYKAKGTVGIRLLFLMKENFTMKNLSGIRMAWHNLDAFSGAVPSNSHATQFKDHVVLITRKPLSTTNVERVFADSERIRESPATWKRRGEQQYLYNIGNVRSERQLKSCLVTLFSIIK